MAGVLLEMTWNADGGGEVEICLTDEARSNDLHLAGREKQFGHAE
jgi:hypothetical protein